MTEFSERLRHVVAHEESLLRAIDDSSAGSAPGAGHWSRKQELGHLIDSAINNRIRFVKAALDGRFEGPSYEQRDWVELGGYSQMPWAGLVDLWKALNTALVTLVARIPGERRTAECRIGGSPPVTLEFVIDDYIRHMQHHLDHVLSRAEVRSYPGAAT